MSKIKTGAVTLGQTVTRHAKNLLIIVAFLGLSVTLVIFAGDRLYISVFVPTVDYLKTVPYIGGMITWFQDFAAPYGVDWNKISTVFIGFVGGFLVHVFWNRYKTAKEEGTTVTEKVKEDLTGVKDKAKEAVEKTVDKTKSTADELKELKEKIAKLEESGGSE